MKHNAEDNIKDLIALYALGLLEAEDAQMVKTHLAKCQECKEEFNLLESLVGTTAYSVTPQKPPPRVKEKIFSVVEKEEKALQKPKKTQDPRAFFTLRASEGEWQEISKGVFSKTLFSNIEAGTITSVIKMLPGAHAELHYHTSIEECFVIEGDFHVGDSEETEIELLAGDYHCAHPGSTHAVAYTNNGTQLLVVMPLNCEIACDLPS